MFVFYLGRLEIEILRFFRLSKLVSKVIFRVGVLLFIFFVVYFMGNKRKICDWVFRLKELRVEYELKFFLGREGRG